MFTRRQILSLLLPLPLLKITTVNLRVEVKYRAISGHLPPPPADFFLGYLTLLFRQRVDYRDAFKIYPSILNYFIVQKDICWFA